MFGGVVHLCCSICSAQLLLAFRIRVMVTVGNHHHDCLPPTRVHKQRLVGECLWLYLPHTIFHALLFFFRYTAGVQLHKLKWCLSLSVRVCAHTCKRQGHFMFVCVYLWVGGMNPNEIFYGPVDLLIVPQVLSLLTPNLLVTTCWAWFFSISSAFPPMLFCALSLSSPRLLKVTLAWLHAARSNSGQHLRCGR